MLHGFVVLPLRWKAERTFGWMVPYRRSKGYDFHTESSEVMIHVALSQLLLRCLETGPKAAQAA